MMRAQQALAYNSQGYLPPEHFNQIFSAHGTIMIFFVAMTFMIGLMNFAVPLQLGVRDTSVHNGYTARSFASELPERMENFAQRFRAPRAGRYVRQPASTDENGIVDLPPAPFDPVPFATVASLVLIGIALGAGYLEDEKR